MKDLDPAGGESITVEPRTGAREVIDAGDLERAGIRVVEQRFGESRSDEAADASDENVHG